MRAIAALLDSRAALSALRRSLPRGAAAVTACRTPQGLQHVLASRLLEAVVLGSAAAREVELATLRARYPGIPVAIYGVIRSDEADCLLAWQRLDVATVAVEGVDDAVVGELVVRQSASARRAASLAEAPRLLRLNEPLQRRTWDLMVASPGRPLPIAMLARTLGLSREHLSRQFGAGGAPNLKRVSDLLTVHLALGLLTNPGYSVPAVAALLGFSTASHLRQVVRRITGLRMEEARSLEPREVLGRFGRLAGRSRR